MDEFKDRLKQVERVYRMYAYPIVVIVGFFGQVITIKIFLSAKDWEATCKIYYLTMAFADLAFLLTVGVPSISTLTIQYWTGKLEYTFEPDNYSHLTCKLFTFAAHVSAFISYWTLNAYALERLLAIWYPFFRIRYINLRNAKLICLAISIFAFYLFAPILFTNTYNLLYPSQIIYYRYCGLHVQNEPLIVKIWYTIAVLVFSFICGPVALIGTNSLLLYKLRNLLKTRAGLAKSKKDQSNPEVEGAKTILIISIITLALCSPLLIWLPRLLIRGVLVTFFNKHICRII